jgi:hypothetical protein
MNARVQIGWVDQEELDRQAAEAEAAAAAEAEADGEGEGAEDAAVFATDAASSGDEAGPENQA